jgi:hypothetical protein
MKDYRERKDDSSGATAVRFAVGLCLLASQIFMIGFARFHPARYFCWAPYDSINEYEITATLDGVTLDAGEIERRYRLPSTGTNPRSIQEIIQIVSYVERVYNQDDRAQVAVVYRTNQSEQKQWRLTLP